MQVALIIRDHVCDAHVYRSSCRCPPTAICTRQQVNLGVLSIIIRPTIHEYFTATIFLYYSSSQPSGRDYLMVVGTQVRAQEC